VKTKTILSTSNTTPPYLPLSHPLPTEIQITRELYLQELLDTKDIFPLLLGRTVSLSTFPIQHQKLTLFCYQLLSPNNASQSSSSYSQEELSQYYNKYPSSLLFFFIFLKQKIHRLISLPEQTQEFYSCVIKKLESLMLTRITEISCLERDIQCF